jgi:hypothetical protein
MKDSRQAKRHPRRMPPRRLRCLLRIPRVPGLLLPLRIRM